MDHELWPCKQNKTDLSNNIVALTLFSMFSFLYVDAALLVSYFLNAFLDKH